MVSSSLLIAFADTVAYKLGGWSGEHPSKGPNELMHWAGISWAHQRGYRYYDFEGVSRAVERAILRGDELPLDTPQGGVAQFKLGFAGLTRFPGTYDFSPNPVLATVLKRVAPRLDHPLPDAFAKRLLGMRG